MVKPPLNHQAEGFSGVNYPTELNDTRPVMIQHELRTGSPGQKELDDEYKTYPAKTSIYRGFFIFYRIRYAFPTKTIIFYSYIKFPEGNRHGDSHRKRSFAWWFTS